MKTKKNQYVLGGLVSIGVGLYLASITIPEFTAARASESWEEVRGVILESKVFKPERPGPNTTRKAGVLYTYVVAGEEYQGRRIFFGATTNLGAVTGLARSANDLTRKYPKGKEVVIYYDPGNPRESVLEQGVVRETIQLLSFCGIFFLAGLVAILRSD
jgi:hypothetical protein